jgi:hypothetical protein
MRNKQCPKILSVLSSPLHVGGKEEKKEVRKEKKTKMDRKRKGNEEIRNQTDKTSLSVRFFSLPPPSLLFMRNKQCPKILSVLSSPLHSDCFSRKEKVVGEEEKTKTKKLKN